MSKSRSKSSTLSERKEPKCFLTRDQMQPENNNCSSSGKRTSSCQNLEQAKMQTFFKLKDQVSLREKKKPVRSDDVASCIEAFKKSFREQKEYKRSVENFDETDH